MALKNIICVIVYHAYRPRAYCLNLDSSFKLFSGTVSLLRFCRRAGHIFREKSKTSGVPPDAFLHC